MPGAESDRSMRSRALLVLSMITAWRVIYGLVALAMMCAIYLLSNTRQERRPDAEFLDGSRESTSPRPQDVDRRPPARRSATLPTAAVTLLVVAKESGIGIADSMVITARDAADTIEYADAKNAGISSTDGRLRVEPTLPGPWIVWAPGRLPRLLDAASLEGTSDPVRVELERAHQLTVSVRDEEGVPVSGARIVVAPHRLGFQLPFGTTGEGNPASNYSTWSQVSDFRGLAVLGGLPKGHLYVDAWHEWFVPATKEDEGKHLFCEADSSVQISLKPLYGVVFEAPQSDEVIATYWRLEGRLETLHGHVIAAAAKGADALRDRFPGCFVYAHRPEDPAREVFLNCWALTRTGSVWTSRWPMRPVSEIQDPIFMETVPGLEVRRLSISLLTTSRKRIPATVVLHHKTLGFGVEASPDSQYVLPEGTYGVGVRRASRELREALRNVEIAVTKSRADGETIEIPLGLELVRISLRARIRGRHGLGVAQVKIEPESGTKHTATSWDPSREALDLYEAPGKIQLMISSVGYESVVIDTEVHESREIEVELVERGRSDAVK